MDEEVSMFDNIPEPRDYDESLFKDDKGRRRTISLFKDFNSIRMTEPGWEPPFTLAEWRKIYLSIPDPTGYMQALVLIGDWDHWQHLKNSGRVWEHVERWQKELEIKIRAQAMMDMMKQSKVSSTSAKYLADGQFATRDKRTKQGKKDEKEITSQVADRVAKDMERLNLKVISNE